MQIKPASAIRIVKFLGIVTSTWPCDLNRKLIRVMQDLRWIISVANVVLLLVPLALGVYYNRHTPVIMTKALSELTALCDVFFNLIICKVQQKQLQLLLFEITEYAANAKGREQKIFLKNVNQYFPFCCVVGISYFQTAIAFSFGPFFMSQILPADAWYPITIRPFTFVYYVIYIQQVVAILQTGLCITVDFMVALLICYSVTKLEILSIELEECKNRRQLGYCILEHQSCINFVQRLTHVIRFMILKSNTTMAMAIIFGAFPIILHQPLPVISQFILMVIGGCLRLYVSAWPADDMTEMSTKIASSIYRSSWIGKPLQMQKSMAIMIQRAQKPIEISILGILPEVSLHCYAKFLSTSLSYFMTLRAIISD